MISLSALTTKATRIEVWLSSVQDEFWNELKLISYPWNKIWNLHIHHDSPSSWSLPKTKYDYMHLKIWSKVPTEEMHILAPHGAGRCTAAAAKADLNVAKIRSEAQKAVSAPNCNVTSGFTSPIRISEKARHSLPMQRLARLPLSWRFKDFCQCFLQRTKQSSGYEQPESTNADKYLWETSQTSIIN